MFFLNVIFGVAVFLLFVFALVVLSRVILLSKQIESVQKVIFDADQKLEKLKIQFNDAPVKTGQTDDKKKK